MSKLEYITALLSIIVGLGLADLAQSLRDLIRPDQSVRWHWLPLAWCGLVLMIVVQFWWSFYGELQEYTVWTNYFAVHLPILCTLCLYLVASFALPDRTQTGQLVGPSIDANDPDSDEVDLEAFYYDPARRRWFFGSLLLYLVGVQANDLVEGELNEVIIGLRLLFAGCFGLLMLYPRERLHATVTIGILALLSFFVLRASLTL